MSTKRTIPSFNSREISSGPEYVLWCDVMGTGLSLATSLHQAANFIFKLHEVFYEATKDITSAEVYPVIDGLYVATAEKQDMEKLIRKSFSDLAYLFINPKTKNKYYEKFMVRGGLAYGETIRGSKVPMSAFGPKFSKKEDFEGIKNRILISSALLLAYNAESRAPPFGIYPTFRVLKLEVLNFSL